MMCNVKRRVEKTRMVWFRSGMLNINSAGVLCNTQHLGCDFNCAT